MDALETFTVEIPTQRDARGSALPAVRGRLSGWRADLLAAFFCLVPALWTTARLWHHVHTRVLGRNPGDHTLFEWMLGYGARLVTHGGNPFLTDRLGVPDGVNLAANTNVLGLSIPLAPVTLLFGPDVSYALLLTLAFTLTAFGWYHVFTRHLVRHRVAALLGGLFCGFAPALVAHANGQPNQVAQFVVPYLVLFTLRLDQRPVRNGLVLGLLAAYQVFVNEEILFITALALGLLVLAYGLQQREELRVRWRPFLTGLGVATGLGVVLLAYPLYVQFVGPRSYRGLPFTPDRYVSDLLSFVTYPRQAVLGDPSVAARLSPSPDEDNASFGWPLIVLSLVLVVWLWRRALVRAAVLTAVVMAALSLGPHLRLRGHATPIPGPFALLQHIPPFTFAVPGRFAMVAVPVIGILLALGVELIGGIPRNARYAGQLRLLWAGVLVGALIPLVPTPLYVTPRPAVPQFISSGAWRAYVPAGRTVVTVPLPAYQAPDPMLWQASQNLDFPLPRGYFLGPSGPGDPTAMFGAPPRPTATKLYAISVLPRKPKPAVGGDTPLGTLVGPTGPGAKTDPNDPALTVTAADRAQARADLRYWRAAIVVLAPQRNEWYLWQTVSDLLGFQPRWVGGLWLWDVRNTIP